MPTLTDIAGTVISSGTPWVRVALLAGAMLMAGVRHHGQALVEPGHLGLQPPGRSPARPAQPARGQPLGDGGDAQFGEH